MSSPHDTTWVYLEDAQADNQVKIAAVPGLVTIRFGGTVINVAGEDVVGRTELLLNRLRMELNAQAAGRERDQ
jgi:hypothetical protein